MNIVERIVKLRADYLRGVGDVPARLVLSVSDFDELAEYLKTCALIPSGAIGGIGEFMGMHLEIGEKTMLRAQRIEGFKFA